MNRKKHFFKRVFTVLMVVIMTLSAVPMSGFVGINLPKFSITASAVEDEEHNEIDIDIYKAQCMLGIASGENENNIYKCNAMYKYYTHNNIYSPSQNYLELCYNDAIFMSEYNSWKAYAFLADPSEALHNSALSMVMKKEEYYESLIISMYYKAVTENNALQKLLENSAIKHTQEIIDQLCEIKAISETSQILEVVSIQDPNTITAIEECVKATYSLSTASDICGIVGDVINYGSDIVDVINRLTIYGSMLQLDNATKAWINQMYNSCTEDSSFPLKSALKTLSLASTDYAGAVLADIKTSAFTFANWSLKAAIDTGISAVASSNPVFGAVFAGLKLGKTICNIFFGTDAVCEQMFMMECIYEVQDLARRVAISRENTFKNEQTSDNAKSFTYAVDCYYESIINIDIDCMKTFLDKLYNGGVIKGSSSDYQEHIAALENLRATRTNNYNDMNDYFRSALKDNYPSIYEFYFVEDGTVPVRSISIYVQCMLPVGYPVDYANILVGETDSAQIEYYPKNTTQKGYVIKSDNPDVVRVDGDKLTGVSEGTANVTIISEDNPYCFDMQKVTVKKRLTDEEPKEIIASGDCGANGGNVTWVLYEDGELIISGSGDMKNYSNIGYPNAVMPPWYENRSLIKKIIINNGVTSIGNEAFYDCNKATTVTIANSVLSIGWYSFHGCGLEQLYLGKNITKIKDGAFSNCYKLNYIEYDIPNLEKSSNEYLFTYAGKSSLKLDVVFTDNVVKIPIGLFEGYNYTSGGDVICRYANVTSVQFGNNVNTIEDAAFYFCNGLTSIFIPESVENISFSAFMRCSNLDNINVDTNNKNYSSVDGVLFDKSSLTLIHFPNKKAKEYTVPDGTKTIADCAFFKNDYLEKIILPQSIMQINDQALYYCTALKDIYIFSNTWTISNVNGTISNARKWGNNRYTYFYDGNIYSYKDSMAQSYAEKYNWNFICIDENLHTHTYTSKITKPATCKTTGEITHTCSCGDSYTESIPKVAHISGQWIVDKASTCKIAGSKHQICSVCGETISNEAIAKTAHKYVATVIKPTCTTNGYTAHKCSVCGNAYTDTVVKATGHKNKTTTTKATTAKDGKVVTTCTVCGKVSKTTTIYKASSIKLSKTSFIYNGKAQKPTVTVKNSKGAALKNGTDYTVAYSSGCKNPGKYAVKVTFKGNYTGSKTLSFSILPGITSSIATKTNSTAIKLTWKAVPGATGYRVFQYDTKTKKYVTVKTLTGTSYTVSKLKSGTTYKFAVKAYSTVNGTVYWASGYKTVTATTNPGTPTLSVTAGAKKATLKWTKRAEATGYVVYMATSKTGKYTKIATVKGNTTVSYTKTGLTTGKTYYFKVAAYKTVSGKNIYSSYSSIKYVKIK